MRRLVLPLLSPVWIVGLLAALFVMVAPFAIPSFNALRDSDTAWLIRTGDWLWQHQRLPASNVFSLPGSFVSNLPWVTYQWLLECLFSGVHSGFGLVGIVGLTSVVYGVSMAALTLQQVRRGFHAWGAVLPAMVIMLIPMAMFANARPHCYTVLLTIGLCLLLPVSDKRVKWMILPAIFALWSNVHMGYIAGLALMALYRIVEIRHNRQPVWPNVINVCLCVLTTGLNPYGFLLFAYLFKLAASMAMMANIKELKPFDFQQSPHMLALIMGGLYCLAQNYKNPLITPFDRLFAFISLALTLYSPKNLYLWLIAITPFVNALYHQLYQGIQPVKNLQAQTPGFASLQVVPVGIVGLIIIALGYSLVFNRIIPSSVYQFPDKTAVDTAARFMKRQSIPQTALFTLPEWGSQLIYYHPELYALIDTRFDMFGDTYFQQVETVLNLRYGWQKGINHFKPQWAVLPPGPLSQALQDEIGYKQAYKDAKVVVLHRRF